MKFEGKLLDGIFNPTLTVYTLSILKKKLLAMNAMRNHLTIFGYWR